MSKTDTSDANIYGYSVEEWVGLPNGERWRLRHPDRYAKSHHCAYPWTPERRFKRSGPRPDWFKKAVSDKLKGKPKPIGFGEKLSRANRGKIGTFLGRKHNEDTIRRMSIGKIGANNPAWIDGRKNIPYGWTFTRFLKRKIFERDQFKCSDCGTNKKIMVHHIDQNKNNSAESNLVTMCSSCHGKLHGRLRLIGRVG